MHCNKCDTDVEFVKSYKSYQHKVTKRVGGEDVETGELIGSGMTYQYECECGYSIKTSGEELCAQ